MSIYKNKKRFRQDRLKKLAKMRRRAAELNIIYYPHWTVEDIKEAIEERLAIRAENQ
jgi:hypothetical protein